ncbi:secreted RxLR effector protein 161-like [Solanum stenotomum]|uniref:secreted RxLR effector protein 161-like n=1 Tax=Solanum stenotomum TaxID=172797 RepID=UPI0020D08F7B|nr:secreted RxLR effector protein 161-like [Solanum stenotomum]
MDCNPVNTPTKPSFELHKNPIGKKVDSKLYKQIVGSLMYLTTTRPIIMYSVNLISRHMENPIEMHLSVAKRTLCYLQGKRDFGLLHKTSEMSNILGYTNSDYAGDYYKRKSTSRYAFIFGSCAISWSAMKQPIVTLSTTEAEFVPMTACACQAIWLRRLQEELKFKQPEATNIFCDNSLAIQPFKNPVLHRRCKHIDVKF